jgi:hypothetical protein
MQQDSSQNHCFLPFRFSTEIFYEFLAISMNTSWTINFIREIFGLKNKWIQFIDPIIFWHVNNKKLCRSSPINFATYYLYVRNWEPLIRFSLIWYWKLLLKFISKFQFWLKLWQQTSQRELHVSAYLKHNSWTLETKVIQKNYACVLCPLHCSWKSNDVQIHEKLGDEPQLSRYA